MTGRATSQTLATGVVWRADSLCKGPGVIAEGTLRDMRTHSIMRAGSGSDLPTRFIALQLAVDRASVRKWKDGVEVLPDQTETKVEVKGYLTREKKVYHPESSGEDAAAAARIVSEALGHAPAGVFAPPASQQSKLHPAVTGVFEFWADAAVFVASDFVRGHKYRLKTRGDCPIVEAVTRMDDGSQKEVLAYYAGGSEIGDSWTEKINRASALASKAAPSAPAGPEDERDESEWD